MPDPEKPLIVTFEVEPGQVWKESKTGHWWEVEKIVAGRVHLRRYSYDQVQAIDLVRLYRRVVADA